VPLELLLEELPAPLGAVLELPPPQAVRVMAASSGTTRHRLGNMRISRYWSSVTSTPEGTRLGT
jgi:hypothetical protein